MCAKIVFQQTHSLNMPAAIPLYGTGLAGLNASFHWERTGEHPEQVTNKWETGDKHACSHTVPASMFLGCRRKLRWYQTGVFQKKGWNANSKDNGHI